MSRWRLLPALSAVAAVVAVGPATPSSAQETSPCTLADLTVEARQLEPARQLYLGLAPQPCRTAGLETVAIEQGKARARLSEARTAKDLGRTDEATRLVNQALAIDQSLEEARAVLRELTGADRPFAAATSLLDAGYDDEARAEARKVVTERVPGAAIPPELRAEGRSSKDQFDTFVDWVTSLLAAAGVIAALGAIPVLWIRKQVMKPRVVLDPFSDPTGAKALPTGRVLTSLLVEEIRSRGTGSSLERVADAPATPDLDLSAALGPQWKWLGAVVNVALKPRTITVRANGHAHGDHQVSVMLTVVGPGGHLVESRTFKKADPDLPTLDLFALVIRHAASWVTTKLVQCGAAERTSMLGTDSWESWGFFRQGVWFHDRRQLDRARTAYLDAIAADHGNGAAWTNLASLDIRRSDAWDLALERLELVESLVRERERKQHLSRRANPLWYRALNLRTTTLLHRSALGGTEAQRTLDRLAARRAANELVRALASAHRALCTTPPVDDKVFASMGDAEKEDLRTLIKGTEDSAVALLASATVELGAVPPLDPVPTDLADDDLVARLADLDETASPATVLGLLYGRHHTGGLPWVAEYNLGCMYARAHDKATRAEQEHLADRALQHLARGLEGRGGELLRWADEKDPALTSLRNGEAAPRFRALIDSLRPPQDRRPAIQMDGWKVSVSS